MKVLFIQFNGMLESLGIAYLAACLEKAGHSADLVLLTHCDDLLLELRRRNPDLIGFSVLTGIHSEVAELCRFIKTHTKIPIIIGGPHATYYADEIASENTVDYICLGEAENALVELANRLSNGGDVSNIPNIWVNTQGGWIKNEMGRLVENLDSLPMPKREIYYKYDFLRDIPMKRFIAGRGCPYSCSFCHNSISKLAYQGKGKYLRIKSVQGVIDEILYVKKRAPLKRVHFSDDLFTLDVKWLREFTEEYPKRAGIPFSCNTRLDSTPETVNLLAEAGCVGVTLGFESGSERMRRAYLKKLWTNEQAKETVRLFKEKGIATFANNMVSLPGETMEEAISTAEWNARIGFDFSRVSLFWALPKLDLVQRAKEEGLLKRDYSLRDYVPTNTHVLFNKEHENELINLTTFFYLAVKVPFLQHFILRRLIKMKPNRFFDFVGGITNVLQYYLFFKPGLVSGLRYFRNTMGRPTQGLRWSSWQTGQGLVLKNGK